MPAISLRLTGALAALLMSSTLASAQCAPDPVANGGTVTCAGTDANGFTSSATGITVDVLAVASVTRSGNDALRLNGADTTVVNAGTVDGGDEGIDIRGANGSITNAAGSLIRGVDRGIDADGINGLSIANSGTITGTGSDAIRLANGATITNLFGASISGADEGIQAGAGLSFTNNGTLTAADEGIEATDNATIQNTGVISAVDDAIQTDDATTITNTGTIRSTENDAIDIDTGSVINSGTIISTGAGEDGIDFDPDAAMVVSTVDNQAGGVISGSIGINVDLANDRAQAITNAGTITGTIGVALFLEDGDDSLTLLGSGILNGTADFGAGADTLTLRGAQAAAVGGGGLFDGGDDTDTAMFDVSVGALISLLALPGLGDMFTLNFANADASISSVTLANFETFAFRDAVLDRAGLAAAVPLPASVLLLGGAIGALRLMRRRR